MVAMATGVLVTYVAPTHTRTQHTPHPRARESCPNVVHTVLHHNQSPGALRSARPLVLPRRTTFPRWATRSHHRRLKPQPQRHALHPIPPNSLLSQRAVPLKSPRAQRSSDGACHWVDQHWRLHSTSCLTSWRPSSLRTLPVRRHPRCAISSSSRRSTSTLYGSSSSPPKA